MSEREADEMLDAQLLAYLHDRAESAVARSRTAEQVAFEIGRRVHRPDRLAVGGLPVLRAAWLLLITALIVALLTWLVAGSRVPPVLPERVVSMAIELPLGPNEFGATAIANGIELAVQDAHRRAGRVRIEIPRSAVLSDLSAGLPDATLGAANMRRIVADPAVVAVIGPFSSTVAAQQLPISRAAGLLQCSPATTNPRLTRPTVPASRPSGSPAATANNYIRTVTTDDVAAASAARYLFERLAKTSVAVVDDDGQFGHAMADWFTAEYTRLGGSVVSRTTASGSAVTDATMLAGARQMNPQAIYFGGSAEHASTLLTAAAAAGLAQIPFVGTDALEDGDAATAGSFLSRVGDRAVLVSVIFPGLVDDPVAGAFQARYRAAYGSDPTPFSAHGFACAQVVMAALQRVDPVALATTTDLRNAVRDAATDPSATVATVVGTIGFDANGDVTPPRVTVYSYEGAGRRWAVTDQIEAAAGFAR